MTSLSVKLEYGVAIEIKDGKQHFPDIKKADKRLKMLVAVFKD